MIILKGSTKTGKHILASLDRSKGVYLEDAYKTYSDKKHAAWCKLWEQYMNDKQAHSFHICSASPQVFTCGWYTWEEDEPIALYFTHMNQYKVYTDR